MTSLAGVNQMLVIPAERVAFAKMRGGENDLAARPFGRLTISLDAASTATRCPMQAALPRAFASVAAACANLWDDFLFPVLRIF